MTNNIVLIGFMGVGKGTIARALARETDMFCLDSDDLIESMQNRKIKTIFENEGEDYFRSLEKETASWLVKNVKNSIISTGGGFFKVKDLNKIGKVVYLKSSFENIINRIESSSNSQQKLAKRPLLKDEVKAKALFAQRVGIYVQKADLIIDVEKKSPEKIIKKIIKKLVGTSKNYPR